MEFAKKILIVDDSKISRTILSGLFKDEYIVYEASNGKEGFELILQNPTSYCVVLLDLNMPVMNGLKMLEVLRNSKNKKQKVLILTIHNEIDYLMKAVDIGVEGYVLKDADSAVLKKAILSE